MTRAPHQNDLIPIKLAHEFFPRPRATIYRWWKDERFVATLVNDTWCVRLSELREVEARMKIGKVRATRTASTR